MFARRVPENVALTTNVAARREHLVRKGLSWTAIGFTLSITIPSYAVSSPADRPQPQPKMEIIWVRDAGNTAQSKPEIVWYRDAGRAVAPVTRTEPGAPVDAGVAPDAGSMRDGGTKVDAGALDASVPGPKDMGVWCGYFVEGGMRRSYCSPLPLNAAKAECDKIASTHYGFPTECSCTDEKSFLQDRCKGPDAGEPVDDARLLPR